jgi:hypothetical protein
MLSNLAYCQCDFRHISLQAEGAFSFSSLHVNNGKPRFGFFFIFRFHWHWLTALRLQVVHLWWGTQRDRRDYIFCCSWVFHAGLLSFIEVRNCRKDVPGSETGRNVNDDDLI